MAKNFYSYEKRKQELKKQKKKQEKLKKKMEKKKLKEEGGLNQDPEAQDIPEENDLSDE